MLKLLKLFPQLVSVQHISQSRPFPRYCQHYTKSDDANSTSTAEATTHFGFETVREHEKEDKGKFDAERPNQLDSTGN